MRKGFVMNNSFDFKRFGQVLAKDWKNYFRNCGISLIALIGLPVFVWIAALILDVDIYADSRSPILICIIVGALLLIPSKVYGKANLSREGVDFAMLPATNLEKFFSMLLYCSILTPLIAGLGSWAVDSLLALMPFGGFKGYCINEFYDIGSAIISFISFFLLISSIFLFGNMVFKKRKAGKTIAWGVLIIFVLSMILQLFGFWKAFGYWEINTELPLAYLNAAFMFVVSIVFYYLTYRKIKNQKY